MLQKQFNQVFWFKHLQLIEGDCSGQPLRVAQFGENNRMFYEVHVDVWIEFAWLGELFCKGCGLQKVFEDVNIFVLVLGSLHEVFDAFDKFVFFL